MEPPPAEYSLSLRDIVRPVWKRLWVVGLVAVVVVGATLWFGSQQTPVYEASIKLLVGPKKGSVADNLGSEVPGLQQLTQTMTATVDTRRVAEAVIKQLNLSMSSQQLLSNLSAKQEGATQVIDVSYRDTDPGRAQRIANAVGEGFTKQVATTNAGANGVTVTVWDSAALPRDPVIPNIPLYALGALVVGLLLGVALAFLLEHLDDSWRSPEQVEEVAGVSAFGVIPAFQIHRARRKDRLTSSGRKENGRLEDAAGDLSRYLVTLLDPTNTASEAYRTLRANVIYGSVDNPPGVVVITSPGRREGKSITCANLGVVLAEAGKSVLIMDCDLRNPTMHKVFGLGSSRGLITVLVQECRLKDALDEPMEGLKILTVGPVPPNPTEVLSSESFAELVRQVRERFDYVLIDGPPVGPVSDPAILSVHADSALLVIDARNTHKIDLRESIGSLEAVGADVLGVVMNNARARGSNGYYGRASRW